MDKARETLKDGSSYLLIQTAIADGSLSAQILADDRLGFFVDSIGRF